MRHVRANKKIKKGDLVRVIAGKSKNKTGKVIKIVTDKNACFVEKVNMIKKHVKPSQQNPQGGIIDKEASLHLSNVVLISAAENAPASKAKKTTAKATTKKATKKTATKTVKKGK